MNLKSSIRVIEDFPKEGISFKDITTLLKDSEALREAVDLFVKDLKGQRIDVIVGPEARGFLFGTAVAYALGVGFVPVRKPGKLPGATDSYEYELEYGTDTLEIHTDAIRPGMRVAIVDDLLATGGTVEACAKLIESMGGIVVSLEFLIELTGLKAREHLNYPIHALVQYDL